MNVILEIYNSVAAFFIVDTPEFDEIKSYQKIAPKLRTVKRPKGNYFRNQNYKVRVESRIKWKQYHYRIMIKFIDAIDLV